MPPLKKSSVKVPNTQQSCRVCLSDNPVMLELFGSETQSVSYAEDVNKCLSIEVKKGDGLPSKICIKCAGVIGEYRPFVDKTLAAESERSIKCDSTSGSSTSCHYCLTSSNILFPVPETSINKTKDCFGFEVTARDQICVRCQFHLEGLHELKLKASAALKHFISNTLSVKKKFSPAKEKDKEKETSVEDIVDNLKDKFNTERPKPERKMDAKEVLEKAKPERKIDKEVSVSLFDIAGMFDDDFLKGTISASKVLQRLQNSLLINGHVSVKVSSSAKSPRQQSNKKVNESVVKEKIHFPSKNDKQLTSKKTPKPQPEKKTRRLSKVEDQTEIDTADDKPTTKPENAAFEGRKRSRVLSEPETGILSKKSRRRSESEKSESEKSVADITQEKHEKDLSDKKGDTPEEEEDQNTKESASLTDESVSEKKRGSRRSRPIKDKTENESPSDVLPKPLQPSIVRPTADTSGPENGVSSESIKPKRKTKKVEFAMDLEADDDDDDEDLKIGNKRKRKLSEDDENFSPKGKVKGKKKFQQSSNSDEEDVIDESPSKRIVLDQPDFLKEMDDLLKSTPKSAFKPFICSVCHEGYISTVKGKLHKLVVHDPHANLVLKLTRCDDNMNAMNAGRNSEVKVKMETKSDGHNEEGNETEMKRTTDPTPDPEETDDLFSDSVNSATPVSGKNNEDLFNSLFDGAKTVGSDEKDCPVEVKIVNDKRKSQDKDSAECDPLNATEIECENLLEEKNSESEKEKPTEEENSENEKETPTEEEHSENKKVISTEEEHYENKKEKPTEEEKSSIPECEKTAEEESEKPIEEKKSEAETDEVKKHEPEKVSEIGSPQPETGSEQTNVNEFFPEKNLEMAITDGQSSNEVQGSEKEDKESPTSKTEEVGQLVNEEAVSSSFTEDHSSSPVPSDEKPEDHENKDSEAELVCRRSPEPFGEDDVSEERQHTRVTADGVDSTTATGEFHHDEVKGGNLPASDKDGESSSVTPDSSAENCEGIIVGDD